MTLNIKPLYYFIDVKPFTYNDIYKINSLLINNPTISSIYDSLYYGKVTFENNKHDLWNIELNTTHNSNTNCLVIKLKSNEKVNPQNSQYLVIYQNITKAINSYGCFWINSDNKVKIMHVSIDYVIENILQAIIKDINFWPKQKLYNAICDIDKEYNAVTEEQVYKEYIETYRCSTYEKWNSLSKQYNGRYKIY